MGFCFYSSAQIQITTRKEKLSDFPMKTTKVVLTGDKSMDECMKVAMKNVWVLSPFEFCSKEEFDSHKSDQDYYFMVLDAKKHKNEKESNTVMITVVKGGTGNDLESMFQVSQFPICAADSINYHRLDAFLPAIVNLIQNHIKRGLYKGFNKIKPEALNKAAGKPIFIAENDLSESLKKYVIENLSSRNIIVTDTENADNIFMEGVNALVSYTFAPYHPTKGSVCYKMLFDARTYELYYYESHVLSGKKGKGFLRKDINKLSRSR